MVGARLLCFSVVLGYRSVDGDGSDHMPSPTNAACSVFGRDTSQGQHRKRILELELKLLQAANDILSVKLTSWIERILQTKQ